MFILTAFFSLSTCFWFLQAETLEAKHAELAAAADAKHQEAVVGLKQELQGSRSTLDDATGRHAESVAALQSELAEIRDGHAGTVSRLEAELQDARQATGDHAASISTLQREAVDMAKAHAQELMAAERQLAEAASMLEGKSQVFMVLFCSGAMSLEVALVQQRQLQLICKLKLQSLSCRLSRSGRQTSPACSPNWTPQAMRTTPSSRP